jgi:hypothetical protein
MRELDRALAGFDHPEAAAPDQPGSRGSHGSHHDATARTSRTSVSNLREQVLQFWSSDSAPDQARARLAAVSLAAAGCGFAALTDFITSCLRLLRPGAPLTGTEMTLAGTAAAALVIAAGIAWARHLSSHVWSSTPRVLEVFARAKRVLLLALTTYAVGMLTVRLFDSALAADPSGAAWPGWAVLTFTAATVVSASATWVMQRLRKPTSN